MTTDNLTQSKPMRVTIAKPSKADFDALYDLRLTLEDNEDTIEGIVDHGDYLSAHTDELKEILVSLKKVIDSGGLSRVLLGCDSLISAACDPQLDYIDFNVEIKAGVDLLREQKAKAETTA